MSHIAKIAIVVPVYNAAKYLHETIASVEAQTFSDWQLILVNDGSKDDSLAILREYEKKDPLKYQVITKANSGVSDTRNQGIDRAESEYIALLDADDQWLPDNLKLKIEFLESNPEYGFVFSDMFNVDAALQNPELAPVGKDQNILEDLLLWNGEVIPGPCSNLLIRKKCFDTGIRFKRNLSTIADQNLTVQLAFGFKGKRIPLPLWNYRILPGSMSKSVKVLERDANNTYLDYVKNDYFENKWKRQKAFAKMYWILAGSYWKDANDKWKASDYLLKSFFSYPPFILVQLNKWFK